jgi:hypothetical protein
MLFGICDFLENCCSGKSIFTTPVNNIVFSHEHCMLKTEQALARSMCDIKECNICT